MSPNTAKLYEPKYEEYAQLIASGVSTGEAAKKLGYSASYASLLRKRPEITRRINELMERQARRYELSRQAVIDRILEDWEQARRLGQMTAALKAGELIGKELHRMFIDRKEIGLPGDFDNKTEAELREYISSELAELGISMSDIAANLKPETKPPAKELELLPAPEGKEPTTPGSETLN